MSEQKGTDIAARLRALIHPGYDDIAGVSTRTGDLRDALAEIERLRAALRVIAGEAPSPPTRSAR